MRKHLAPTPVFPSVGWSVGDTFGFPFCQRLWALTKRRDDIVVVDMEVDKVAEIRADMELEMVADMEVDKVADMEVDMVADMEVDVVADKEADIDINIDMEI